MLRAAGQMCFPKECSFDDINDMYKQANKKLLAKKIESKPLACRCSAAASVVCVVTRCMRTIYCLFAHFTRSPESDHTSKIISEFHCSY